MTRCAASAMVCRPVEQKRFTVTPAVVTGQPARSATWPGHIHSRGPLHERAADDDVFDFAGIELARAAWHAATHAR